jgi:type IV pilus assembly protein PilM
MSSLSLRRPGLLASPPAHVGLEISPRRITAVWLHVTARGASVSAHASVALPEGAVVPSLTGQNIQQPDAVQRALADLLGRLPGRARRAALVVPDLAGKVSLVHFEKKPDKLADLDRLVRWQIRKSAPFSIDEARLAFQEGPAPPQGGHEFVVVVARREVVREYETACERAGVQVGVVDLASLNLVNAVLLGDRAEGRPRGDWLLVHLASGYSTLAVVRGGGIVFFRNRASDGDESLVNLVHQTTMYYEDRLGGTGFERVLVADTDGDPGLLPTRELEERLRLRLEPVDPRRAAPFSEGGGSPSGQALSALASPVALVLREWVA